MGRALFVAFLVGVALFALPVLTAEPTEPAAVAAAIAGLALVAFAVTSASLVFVQSRWGPKSRRRTAVALRRGVLAGLLVATLAGLRAADALSVITAAFALALFAALEGMLSSGRW